jgi:signal transduction histidine kinase
VDYFFTPPAHTISLDLAHIPRLVAFTSIAVLFASTSAARRRAERSLREARDELEVRVRERTADLSRAHAKAVAAHRELEELAGRLIHAQEEERSRIGRELHDHISQMLGVLTIRLDQLRGAEGTPPDIAGSLAGLRENASEIASDIHGLSHRLHSSALDYLGLVPAVQKLVTDFSVRYDIPIDFAHEGVPSLPADVALCLFRITEEGLMNLAKHSHATSAAVRITGGPDGVRLTIEDNGVGFNSDAAASHAGLGFVSMRERLRVLRGSVRLDSAPGCGTRIEASVPAAATGASQAIRSHELGAGASDALTPSS